MPSYVHGPAATIIVGSAFIRGENNNRLLERCTLVNVSDEGAWLSINDVHDLPAHFKLHLVRGAQNSHECRVVWRKRNEVGVEFV